MVRHEDKVMKVKFFPVPLHNIQKRERPAFVAEKSLPAETEIALEIHRDGGKVFSGATTLNEMKRKPEELVEYLYRNNSFPQGCFLLTGTGVVPPDSFTLKPADEIRITIPPIGTLINKVG